MLACCALIAALVVARETRHQLLGLRGGFVLGFLLEVLCLLASQSCCQPPAMKYLDIAVLSHAVGKAETVELLWVLHSAL